MILSKLKHKVYGVGINSAGVFTARHQGKMTKEYSVWCAMLARCYSVTNKNYDRYGERGVTVCDEWLDFQCFAEFYTSNYVEGFHLDKDLKVFGNKVYSPDTCEFIPSSVNRLLTSNRKTRGDYPIGVRLHDRSVKFRAVCSCGKGRQTHIGLFSTIEGAFLAYKSTKEAYVKEVAQYHYDLGEISKQIYDNLMAWEASIDD